MKKKENKEKKATPPRFSPEITRAFCEQIAEGAGGRKAAVGVSRTTLLLWISRSIEFRATHADACAARIAALENCDKKRAVPCMDLQHLRVRPGFRSRALYHARTTKSRQKMHGQGS